MIEINPAFAGKKDKLKSQKGSGKKGQIKSTGLFQTSLESEIEASESIEIETIMDDLKDQEKKFLDAQSLAELNNYKNKVKKLLDMIVKGSFKTVTLKRRRRDRADFLVIKNINENLLDLSRMITSENKSFNLLKKLDEIRGLIFDLVY